MATTAVKKKMPVRKNSTVKVTWMRTSSHLNQVYKVGLEYCFVSKDDKQCCPFVFCKDFLQDAILAMHMGKGVSIFGFRYNPKTCEPLVMNRMRMAIGNSNDAEFPDKIEAMLDFINQFEKKLRLVRTRIQKVQNPPTKYKSGVFILEGSSRWLLSPPMVSLYTLLIRVGCVHKKGSSFDDTMKAVCDGKTKPYQWSDKSQLVGAKSGIERILKYGYSKIFYKEAKKNYPDVNIGSMHGSMGICAFSREASKFFAQHWHRNLDVVKKKKGTKK